MGSIRLILSDTSLEVFRYVPQTGRRGWLACSTSRRDEETRKSGEEEAGVKRGSLSELYRKPPILPMGSSMVLNPSQAHHIQVNQAGRRTVRKRGDFQSN